ncbi:MAG: hypothetical protein WC956_02810 [bacterium]
MKKLIVLAVAVSFGLAVSASAQVETKKTTEVKGGTSTTTTEVKTGTAKAKETVTTSGGTTTTEQTVKGKNVKIEKENVATATGETGMANIAVKKGAIEDLKIEWSYKTVTTKAGAKNYVVDYTINDKTNKNLLKELNLTAEQSKLIAPGQHEIVSTSEFTGEDIRNNLRAVILKDIANMVNKAKVTK